MAPFVVPRSPSVAAVVKGTVIPATTNRPFDWLLDAVPVVSVSWASRIVAPSGIWPAAVPKIWSNWTKYCRSSLLPPRTPSMYWPIVLNEAEL